MMIKVFTKNENDKIELTTDELKDLLDEAYWEGYRSNTSLWTYASPDVSKPPYKITCFGDSQATVKLNPEMVTEQAINFIEQMKDSARNNCYSTD